jgi:uncharacterized protein YjbI with pentapeptide repeats
MPSARWRAREVALLVGATFLLGVGVGNLVYAALNLLPTGLVADLWLQLVGGVIAVVALWAWWLWWRLPKRQLDGVQLTDPKDRADVEDNFRKTISQLLGGAAVLIGAGFAYFQFQQQQTAAHDLLISNQVSKGFEQLGGDKLPVRLGGIYALEGVMNTSEQYHRPVVEALCAFVRESTKDKTGTASLATDVQAALTVVGRRGEGGDFIELREAHMSLAVLTGANLESADLISTELSHAYLERADVKDALLIGTDLTSAYLKSADLTYANLAGANLSGADLTSAEGLTQEQLIKPAART